MIFLVLSAFLLSLSIPTSVALDNIAIAIGLIGLFLICKKFRFDSFDLRVILVSLVGTISSLLSSKPFYSIKESHYLWHFLPYFISSRVDRNRIKHFVALLGVAGVVSSLAVAFESFTRIKPQAIIHKWGHINFFPHPNSTYSSGFFTNHLTTGAIISSLFLLFLSYSVFYNGERKFRLFSIIVSIFLFGGLLLTFCRTYWIGTLVAIFFLPFMVKNRTSLAIALSIAVIAAGIYLSVPSVRHRVYITIHFHKDSSAMERIVLWRAGLQTYKHYSLKKKLIGCGSGNVFGEFKPYLVKTVEKMFHAKKKNVKLYFFSALHNEYLQILIKWGIIGLIIWIYLWLYVLWRNIVFLKKTTSDFYRTTIIGLTMGFIAFLVGGFFEHNVGDAEVIIMVMFLLGINKNILDSLKEGV